MSISKHAGGLLGAVTASALMIAPASGAQTEALTLTDIAGRQVTLDALPDRIVLGKDRMMYSIAPLLDGNPFDKIMGWKDDLIQYDPDAFRKFEGAFPEDTARLISFATASAGDFSIEAVLEAETDLVILDVGNLFKAEETGLIDKLGDAGFGVVFVDFRRNSTENTVPSLLLLGRILGEERRAADFIDFYIGKMRKVTNVVDAISQVPVMEKNVERAFRSIGAGVLTPREREVVEHTLRGHSADAIGKLLGISPGTVRIHRKNIYSKLRINSQGELFSEFLSAIVEGQPLSGAH